MLLLLLRSSGRGGGGSEEFTIVAVEVVSSRSSVEVLLPVAIVTAVVLIVEAEALLIVVRMVLGELIEKNQNGVALPGAACNWSLTDELTPKIFSFISCAASLTLLAPLGGLRLRLLNE